LEIVEPEALPSLKFPTSELAISAQWYIEQIELLAAAWTTSNTGPAALLWHVPKPQPYWVALTLV
jgi:hypothetical protein